VEGFIIIIIIIIIMIIIIIIIIIFCSDPSMNIPPIPLFNFRS